jgi:hypothetical protein
MHFCQQMSIIAHSPGQNTKAKLPEYSLRQLAHLIPFLGSPRNLIYNIAHFDIYDILALFCVKIALFSELGFSE